MSIISKKWLLIQRTLNCGNCTIISNRHNFIRVFSSTKINSKNLVDDYKVVKSSIRRTHDNEDCLEQEGGPNWELFATNGNRFFLPGSMGPAWQSEPIISNFDEDGFIPNLMNLHLKVDNKLKITINDCPKLLRRNIHELFPISEDFTKGTISILTLSYSVDIDFEASAINFVQAAREIGNYLRYDSYWADFMNPFSGKPFFGSVKGKQLYKIDQRFRGLGMNLHQQDDCLIISSSDQNGFSGNIFTNAPSDVDALKAITNLCTYKFGDQIK